jgi:SAM-dependent methyltransferase
VNCRHCGSALHHLFLDLGFAPPSNAYLTTANLREPETYYPLRLYVCDNCWLVQTEDYAKADELFNNDYAYFSSTSRSWLEHAAKYSREIIDKLGLSASSQVMEIAANDGYLLRNFVDAGIPCVGIEPTGGTADAAERLGIPVVREFFGSGLAKKLVEQGKSADLVIGNNVYAHVPDINDFTAGIKTVLKPGGTVTLEFAHLMRLIEHCQFDTVYHEHFSYLSLHTVTQLFSRKGLRVFDVQQLPTHGGSLRVYGCHANDPRPASAAVAELLAQEGLAGLRNLDVYRAFQARADKVKDDLVRYLIEAKRQGKTVIGYGAAAKGNTLLNYAGVRQDLLPFICDAAPSKQGKFTPGGHIPIVSPDAIPKRTPDVVLILPWNIAEEISAQLRQVREWGGQFVVAVPELRTL